MVMIWGWQAERVPDEAERLRADESGRAGIPASRVMNCDFFMLKKVGL